MSQGININYGSLNMQLPAVNTAPVIAAPVAAALGNVGAYQMDNQVNTAPAYTLANNLIASNANFTSQMNAANEQSTNAGIQAAEYQANAISNQGKK